MNFQRYLVIHSDASSLRAIVTSEHGSKAPPQPTLSGVVYPRPPASSRPLQNAVAHFWLSYYKWAIRIALVIYLGIGLYVMPIVLSKAAWASALSVAELAAFCMLGWQVRSLQEQSWYIDADERVFRAGPSRIELSHVAFIKCAERFSNDAQNSNSAIAPKIPSYGLELVSLSRPIFLPFLRHSSAMNDAAAHLNAFLDGCKPQHCAEVPLPCNAIRQFGASSGSVKLQRRSVLLKEALPNSSLRINEREDQSLWCYRRLIPWKLLQALLRFSAYSMSIWLLCVFVALLNSSLRSDNSVRRPIIIISASWAALFLLLLVVHARREKWCMTREGVVLHYVGWPLLSIRHTYHIYNAEAVTLNVAEAETPGSVGRRGINMMGGRRFGLSWRDGNGQQLLKIEKLLGGEAAHLADKVRRLYPHMFGDVLGAA